MLLFVLIVNLSLLFRELNYLVSKKTIGKIDASTDISVTQNKQRKNFQILYFIVV